MSSTEHVDDCKWAKWQPYVWDGRKRYPISPENPMHRSLAQINAAIRGDPPCQCSGCRTDLNTGGEHG